MLRKSNQTGYQPTTLKSRLMPVVTLFLLFALIAFAVSACSPGATTASTTGSGSTTASTTAGSTGETTGATSQTSSTAGESTGVPAGYYFETNGVVIQIDAPAAPILEKLGEPMNYFEAKSCAFDGMDKIYSYSGYEFQTYTLDGVDLIFSIRFLDDSVATREGISLNATLADVTKAYGTDYETSTKQIIFKDEASKLTFLMEDDAVVAIEYGTLVAATQPQG